MEIVKDIHDKLLKADELLYLDRVIEARSLLEEILEEEPASGKAHFRMGMLFHSHLYELPRAAVHYNYAIHFEPEFPYTWYAYARLLLLAGKYKEHERLCKKALNVSSVCSCCIHRSLSESAERRQKFSKALQQNRKAFLAGGSCFGKSDYEFVETRLNEKRKVR